MVRVRAVWCYVADCELLTVPYLVVRCGSAVRVVTRIGTSAASSIACTAHTGTRTTAAVAGAIVIVAEVWLGVPLVDDKVDWHLALQTTDVTLTKVVAQFVNLWGSKQERS